MRNRYQIQEEQTLMLKEGATMFFIEHCERKESRDDTSQTKILSTTV